MKAGSLPLFRRQLGAAIREQRTVLRLSRSELAALANFKCDYVGKVERGEQNIKADTLDRFFAALTAASGSTPCHPVPPPPDMPPGMVLLQVIATAVGISIAQIVKRTGQRGTPGKAHDEAYDPVNRSERRIMEACSASSRSAPELLKSLGYAARTGNFNRALKHLVLLDFLELTIPTRPRSKNQKYRLTVKGKAWLAAAKDTPHV